MSQNQQFTLIPATLHDIPTLSLIAVTAFFIDPSFPLIAPSFQAYQDLYTSILPLYILSSTYTCIKVLDTLTGKIAAWAAWETVARPKTPGPSTNISVSTAIKNIKPNISAPRSFDTYMINIASIVWEKHANRHPHILFTKLVTDPGFQGRGMGTALTYRVWERDGGSRGLAGVCGGESVWV